MKDLTCVLSMLKYLKYVLLAVGLMGVASCGYSTPTAPTRTSPATFPATVGQARTLDTLQDDDDENEGDRDDDDDDEDGDDEDEGDRDDDDDDEDGDDDDEGDDDNDDDQDLWPPNGPPMPTPPPPTGTRITYVTDVAPILASDCVRCHGGPAPAAGRDYTTYAGVMKVVRLDRPTESRLIRMTQPGGDMFGNFTGTLAERMQKAETIRRWVVEFAAAEQ